MKEWSGGEKSEGMIAGIKQRSAGGRKMDGGVQTADGGEKGLKDGDERRAREGQTERKRRQ